MTKRLLDYNPLTGEKTWFQFDHVHDRMTITEEQDVQPYLDWAAELRSRPDYSRKGIKKDMWHYAKVPNVIIMEMKTKHGVDFFKEEDWPKVSRLLETEYSRFKTTHGKHLAR